MPSLFPDTLGGFKVISSGTKYLRMEGLDPEVPQQNQDLLNKIKILWSLGIEDIH